MTSRLLVVQHQDTCPPALLGRWLAESGLELDVRRPDQGQDLPADLAGHDALMVLGGTMDSFDEAGHPWLADTVALLRHAVRDTVPTLGICLGHQLLARACGGLVARNPRGRQLGLVSMGWTETARDDALVGVLATPGRQARGLQWNQDIVVEVPADAVVLARTPFGEPQVVRFAARAWGIQAHPEVDEQVARWWAADAAPDVVPGEADRVVTEVAAAAEELRETWRPLATRFADLVGAGSEARA